MINLLSLLGTVIAITSGPSYTRIMSSYNIDITEYRDQGDNAVLCSFEVTPLLDLVSDYFEPDTGFEFEGLAPIIYETELADTIYDDIEYFQCQWFFDGFLVKALTSPVSRVEVSFNFSFNYVVHFFEGDVLSDEYVKYYTYTFDTNFTIFNDFSLLNDVDLVLFQCDFGLDHGYDKGYADGREVGYEDGYDNGFINGEEYGYKQGSNDLDNVFNGSWVDWLGNAVTGFFALEIFPGFTLGGALGAVLCAYIMMWILKVLAGG